MENVLDAHSSDRVAAFSTQIYQQSTLEYRFNCTIYTGEQEKASGANVTETSFAYKILC